MNPLTAAAAVPAPGLHAAVRVLVSNNCPHCARVIAELAPLRSQNVTVQIIHVADAALLCERLHVQAVPATIVGEDLVIIGEVTAARVARLVSLQGTPEFDTERLVALLERDRLQEAVQRLAVDIPVRAVAALLAEPALASRMAGALLVERAQEVDASKLRGLAECLLGLLSHPDARIRGDVAMVLGSLADRAAESALRDLLNDADPDVREAAAEALEQLGV